MKWLLLPLLLLQTLLPLTLASSGDRDPRFELCLETCADTFCTTPTALPFILRVTRWNCEAECKYECMHKVTEIDETDIKFGRKGAHIQQFYGKWPFVRLWGMQEPASVAFSVANGLAHWYGGKDLLRHVRSNHPMRTWYVGWIFCGVNLWFWSAIFHIRDTRFTERMDYFSAAGSIIFGVYMAVVRLFHLYRVPRLQLQSAEDETPASLKNQGRALWAWSIICIIVLLGHIGYLTSTPRFDYSYNMKFGITIGAIHSLLWATYSLPSRLSFLRRFDSMPKAYRPSFASQPIILVSLMAFAMSLEVLDFPPWKKVIDAHSLWHLATVPIVVMWYSFLKQDALDEGWGTNRW